MTTTLRALLAALLGGGLLVGAAGAGHAGAPGHADRPTAGPVATSGVTSAVGQRDVRDYWTAERMRAAVPVSAGLGAVSLSLDPVDVGVAVSVPAATAHRAAGGEPESTGNGERWTDGGRVVATTGKVFFTLDGRDFVCSGSATSSDNRAVVTTAGHCVKDGTGAWARNWAFVPGYDDGSRPHGTFPAERLTTTRRWAAGGDYDYDVGMAVVAPRDGRRLTDVVGGQGIAFNQPRGEELYAFGFPAADGYDGGDLVSCSGVVFDDTYGGSNDQGMRCDMTGGSSGGPWLRRFDGSSGQISSVNSFGYRGVEDVMWGPYFGEAVRALYARAERL